MRDEAMRRELEVTQFPSLSGPCGTVTGQYAQQSDRGGGVRQVNPSFRLDADWQSDLEVLWEDGERVFCRGWRADGDGGRGSVLVVLPTAERPLSASLERLAHEYDLRDELAAAWAARPLALARERGRTALLD